MEPKPPTVAAVFCSWRRMVIISASENAAYGPVRELPAPLVQVTPPNQRSSRAKHSRMPWKAMNSRSSWWAPIPRWVTRCSACASGVPSGMNVFAVGRCSFMGLFFEFWQTGGGDRLADAAGLFVRHVHGDRAGDFRKLARHDLARFFQHDVAALAGGHPAED